MIELGLTPDFRWRLPANDIIAAAQAAGFSAVGVKGADVDGSAQRALADSGLRCHEVLALMFGPDEQTNLEQARQLAEAAAALHAPSVVTTFVGPVTDDTRRIVERCAAIVAEAGARLAIEFTPFGEVSSIPAALTIADFARAAPAAVVIDTWHFFRCGGVWADLEAVPLDRIAHVQFDDAPEPESDNGTHETINRRLMPGDGQFDLERFVSTLRGRGWDGVVSVEVLNSELTKLPVDEFAALAYAKTAPYWR